MTAKEVTVLSPQEAYNIGLRDAAKAAKVKRTENPIRSLLLNIAPGTEEHFEVDKKSILDLSIPEC